jgi:response regulator RpfG family c-di-GMP phosphodiesterase
VSENNTAMRLDEILIREGLVTEEQVRKALEYQKEHGGRIGSHLMRLGFVDETGILRALSIQFECEAVVLSGLEIPADIIETIPANVAIARIVIPFAYDTSTDTLSIACHNPKDESLLNELKFVAGGRRVKLYVAAELPLKAAVARFYMVEPHTSGVEVPAPAGTGSLPVHDETGEVQTIPPRGSILLVSDEMDADAPLRHALEQQDYKIVITTSADEAIEVIGSQSFHTVFIRDTVQGDYIDLIDRLRKVSPRTNVRYYESSAQLLLNTEGNQMINDLVVKNLQLFTSLLSSRENLDENHAGTVGLYVDRLCRQMGIPDKDRLNITNAAYVHDMSRFYYGESQSAPDCRTRIQLTAKLLDSLNYSPLIIEILRSMYINLRQKYTKRLPIETLGGNIVTIVDIFCENVSMREKMSLDKFEAVRNNLTSLSGKLFLPEVVRAFVEMIEEEILIEPTSEKYNQALMYCEDLDTVAPLSKRLKDEGFRPVALDAVDRFVELYQRSRPDMMIIVSEGRAARAITLVDELIRRGIEIMKVPTFLLTGQEAAAELTSMFERGIEDIIPLENSLDLLVVKMRKLRARVESKAKSQTGTEGKGTAGSLEAMNLIDLLQALGPSGKTARIQVISNGAELALYLDKGRITFAQVGEKTGAQAVYEALAWSAGNWIVQPVADGDLPEPNNEHPNESILMEGCRLLDERQRAAST